MTNVAKTFHPFRGLESGVVYHPQPHNKEFTERNGDDFYKNSLQHGVYLEPSLTKQNGWDVYKLDGVGLVVNRPFTDQLHNLKRKCGN